MTGAATAAGCVGDCVTGDYFGWLAETYDAYRPTDVEATRAEVDVLVAAAGAAAPGHALDVMCGPGRHALELLRRGWTVTGVDRTGPLLDLLSGRAAAAGVQDRLTTHVADAYVSALPGPVDVAFVLGNSFGFGAGVDACARLLRSLRAALRPGGTLLLEVFDVAARRAAQPGGKAHPLPDGRVLTKTLTFDGTTSTEHASVRVQGTDTGTGTGTDLRTCYRQLVPDERTLVALVAGAGFVDVGRRAGWPSTGSLLLVARVAADDASAAAGAMGDVGGVGGVR